MPLVLSLVRLIAFAFEAVPVKAPLIFVAVKVFVKGAQVILLFTLVAWLPLAKFPKNIGQLELELASIVVATVVATVAVVAVDDELALPLKLVAVKVEVKGW